MGMEIRGRGRELEREGESETVDRSHYIFERENSHRMFIDTACCILNNVALI